MSPFAIFTLAVALAMDAFAVSISAGCSLPRITIGHYLRMGGAFGFFQFMMPVIGCFLGQYLRHFIESWDHWAAFALLAYVAISMIRESFEQKDCEDLRKTDPSRGLRLIVLAVATSLDALAVGLSFALLGVNPLSPSLVIGIVCAVISAAGLWIGSRLAKTAIFGQRAELFGGFVLLCIGGNILIEHGVFDFPG